MSLHSLEQPVLLISMLDTVGGPTGRRDLHDHATPALRAVAGRLEFTCPQAGAVITVLERAPAPVAEHL